MKDDSVIVDLYWARSQQAIVLSEQKYGRYCHTVAWNILRSEADSEECVNDTWLHAWNAMPPHRPGVLRTFLGKITRNLALNRYESSHAQRRGGGETQLCLDELAECLPDGNDPEHRVEELTLKEVLNRFLGEMKEEERRIFVLRYWYVVPVKEIAARMRCSESKVKMTLLRSRKKLEEALAREEIWI